MINNLKQIESLTGLALTQKLGVGKFKGKYIWELPEWHLQYCHKRKIFDYDKVKAKIEEAKRIKPIEKINTSLRKYDQSEIPEWAYHYQIRELMRFPGQSRIIINGCIGSGKTIIALILSMLYGYKKTLIVVPKTIHSSWIDKIVKHTGKSYCRLDGTIEESIEILNNTNYTFYITNQERFMSFEADITKEKKSRERTEKKNDSYKRLLFAVAAAKFEFVFFDESHLYLQNHSTDLYKNIRALLDYIPHAYLMTGTFFSEGREERAIDQLHLINPDLFQGRAITTIYKQRFILNSYRKPIMLDPKFAPALAKLISANSMIITADELKLPKPVFEVREIEMRGDLWTAYQKAEREMMIELQSDDVSIPAKIALITRLRQISGGSVLEQRFKNNDKLSELVDVVNEYGNESFIIGCQYKEEIALIKEKLKGYKIGEIHGDISIQNKDKAKQDFLNKKVQCLIIQFNSGAGIDNLQDVCRFGLIYSGTYESTKLKQWLGRIFRNGQMTNAVFTFLRHVRPDGKSSIDDIMNLSVEGKNEKETDFMKMIMESKI